MSKKEVIVFLNLIEFLNALMKIRTNLRKIFKHFNKEFTMEVVN